MPRRGDNTFDHSEIVAFAKDGMRQPAIAELLNCSLSTVTNVIREARAAGESIPTPPRVKRVAAPKLVSPAPKQDRGPRSPMEESGLFAPIPGVTEDEASRVLADLKRRGLDELIAMLGLSQSAVAS